jgi:hypothetical protein
MYKTSIGDQKKAPCQFLRRQGATQNENKNSRFKDKDMTSVNQMI